MYSYERKAGFLKPAFLAREGIQTIALPGRKQIRRKSL